MIGMIPNNIDLFLALTDARRRRALQVAIQASGPPLPASAMAGAATLTDIERATALANLDMRLLQARTSILGGLAPGGALSYSAYTAAPFLAPSLYDSVMPAAALSGTTSTHIVERSTIEAIQMEMLAQQRLIQAAHLAEPIALNQAPLAAQGQVGSLLQRVPTGAQQQPTVAATAHAPPVSQRDPTMDAVFNTMTFPERLHRMVTDAEASDQSHIISFAPSGKAFFVHDRAAFLRDIAPRYCNMTKFTSFKRQMYLYGFEIVRGGPEDGAHAHPLFQKGKPELAAQIQRQKKAKRSQSED